MTVRIYDSLLKLADDEGHATATKTAQRWQSALEEMTECGSREEQDAAIILLRGVESAIRKLVSERSSKTLRRWGLCSVRGCENRANHVTHHKGLGLDIELCVLHEIDEKGTVYEK